MTPCKAPILDNNPAAGKTCAMMVYFCYPAAVAPGVQKRVYPCPLKLGFTTKLPEAYGNWTTSLIAVFTSSPQWRLWGSEGLHFRKDW